MTDYNTDCNNENNKIKKREFKNCDNDMNNPSQRPATDTDDSLDSDNKADINLDSIKLKVGFEIHQQLAAEIKLFCNCKCIETEKYSQTFTRRLRPTQSELGSYDPAALFEFQKMRTIQYHVADDSSCLVEADEEPPHDINQQAIDTALLISLALDCNIIDEIHPMRKIVIDGSNTTGFQRTMLIATGGHLKTGDIDVGVQSVCLEEDAAKLISDNGTVKDYGLDRLGTPLLEIALEPITGNPDEIMKVALTLGRLLRASKRVARGLGTIRQDVNISVEDGSVVEVKGVQQLDQLTKIIKYEAMRQKGLYDIARKLNSLGISDADIGDRVEDVSEIFSKSNSNTVKKTLKEPGTGFKAIRVKKFSGIIGYEPYKGIRLGRQLGELVRFYGLGGVFHSDELPNYGITADEVNSINTKLDLNVNDAFVVVGGPKERVDFAVDALIKRLRASLEGVPAETRAALPDGRTVFSRPRPGAARMYPETDIFPIAVDSDRLESLRKKIPKSWEEEIAIISKKYGLNKKLAEQIFDSDYLGVFEEIAKSTNIQPTFIASKLTEDIISLQRQGYNSSRLDRNTIIEIFKLLDGSKIAKESVILLFGSIMRGDAKDIDGAIKSLRLESLSEEELNLAIDKILKENRDTIDKKGLESLGMLMGRTMATLRGKADGQKINQILRTKLYEIINKDNK